MRLPDVDLEDGQQLDEPVRRHRVHGLHRLELGRLVGQVRRLVLGNEDLRRRLSVVLGLLQLLEVNLLGVVKDRLGRAIKPIPLS